MRNKQRGYRQTEQLQCVVGALRMVRGKEGLMQGGGSLSRFGPEQGLENDFSHGHQNDELVSFSVSFSDFESSVTHPSTCFSL